MYDDSGSEIYFTQKNVKTLSWPLVTGNVK
jgi:hypothetical protein